MTKELGKMYRLRPDGGTLLIQLNFKKFAR